MKSVFYLYEVNKWDEILPHVAMDEINAYQYINIHIERLQELLERESHIASDKYSKEHDTCPYGAYDKIVKDRKDAIEFWRNKLQEL